MWLTKCVACEMGYLCFWSQSIRTSQKPSDSYFATKVRFPPLCILSIIYKFRCIRLAPELSILILTAVASQCAHQDPMPEAPQVTWER